MVRKEKPRLSISTKMFCSLMISNGVLVASLCYASVLPMAKQRSRELGTIEASQEVVYLYGLIGLGFLVSTVFALLSQSFLLFRGRFQRRANHADGSE
jgi:hypothetical protein